MHFERRVIDALFTCIKRSLEAIRKRIHGTARAYNMNSSQVDDVGGGIDYSGNSRCFESLFYTNVELVLPSIVIHPSLEELQHAVTAASQVCLKTTAVFSDCVCMHYNYMVYLGPWDLITV